MKVLNVDQRVHDDLLHPMERSILEHHIHNVLPFLLMDFHKVIVVKLVKFFMLCFFFFFLFVNLTPIVLTTAAQAQPIF